MSGPTVQFLGRVDDAQLQHLMARAKAYVMPGEEDFGIAPVEANACGRPVIAFDGGGARDTQIDGVTGVLFRERTVDSLCDAICRADKIAFDPVAIREHAEKFDTERFREDILHLTTGTAAAIAEVPKRGPFLDVGAGSNSADTDEDSSVALQSFRGVRKS
jgi:glycosyltransferase involved in cell wall biosynthesis